MRIKVIFIASKSEGFIANQRKERERLAGQNTKLEIVSLIQGPESIENSYSEAMCSRYLLEEVKKAEKEGFDAVIIDCALDPVLRAAKEASNIPVVSAGESAVALALLLGDRFSIIAPVEETIYPLRHNIRGYGLTSRLASIRHVDIPVIELEDVERAKEVLQKRCRQVIDEDGADVIILGCTGMAPVARYLNETLEVPVVEPAAAAIKIAEIFIQLGWKHSKRCFPTPSSILSK